MTLFETIIALAYLLAASLFILGIKYMSSPATARKGNLLGSIGMFIAIVVTLLDKQVINYTWILGGIVIGSLIGSISARKVKMTDMPQMVGIFNGFGGGASALVAVAEFFRLANQTQGLLQMDTSISIALSVIIGGVTLTGSFIAFGKLQGFVSGSPVQFPLQKIVNALVILGAVALSVYLIGVEANISLFYVVIGLSLLYGILFVIPIGGADMPVVISL